MRLIDGESWGRVAVVTAMLRHTDRPRAADMVVRDLERRAGLDAVTASDEKP